MNEFSKYVLVVGLDNWLHQSTSKKEMLALRERHPGSRVEQWVYCETNDCCHVFLKFLV